MSKLTTRIITRNDYDVNWQNNTGLPLLPGELAISIPTREFNGDTDTEDDIVIAANEISPESPARVIDKDKDMIIKIGDGSSFYNSDNIITGTAGVLTQFDPYGTEVESQENIIELAKNEAGVTKISIRQARKEESTDGSTDYKSGIMSSEDYKNYTTIAEFFGASSGGALTISEETIKGAIAGAVTEASVDTDESLEFVDGKLGVSGNIFWVCGDSSSDTNNAAV